MVQHSTDMSSPVSVEFNIDTTALWDTRKEFHLGADLQSMSERPKPSKSPRRLHTAPELSVHDGTRPKPLKRIVVFCDGTWQDGFSSEHTQYTNVVRLARSVNYYDERFGTAIPQIIFYQAGVGSDGNVYSKYVEGGTGSTLIDKVEEAYGFIAHNYSPGDEIFIFGFSRGAYTARMVATFIGEIGVLDRKDMDQFNTIFLDYQTLGKTEDEKEKKVLEDRLASWRSPNSNGKRRADVDRDKFTIKCLGVWDTVGALGLPEEITMSNKKISLFGFHDRYLGDHIEHAFQALALNETRADFNCTKFIQTDTGRRKNQTLKQCWFAGSHSDIGGGYKHHDLADLTLIWMSAHIESFLSLDTTYLQNVIQPVAPWGQQQPHNSITGIFCLADQIQRELPTRVNDPETHEYFHPSVLEQANLKPTLMDLLEKEKGLISPLKDLEVKIKQQWNYDPTSAQALQYAAKLKLQIKGIHTESKFLSGFWFLYTVLAPILTKPTSWMRALTFRFHMTKKP